MSGEKPILVGCDLFLDLRLYCLPDQMLKNLRKNFPTVEIVPVNVPKSPEVRSDIDVYFGNRITPAIINSCPDLRWIHFGSVGTNHARVDSVINRGIHVTSSRGLVVAPMVASAIAFIAGLARGLSHSTALRTSGNLTREAFDSVYDQVQELEGQEILIVGLGDVGKRLAKVCDALGMEVVGIRRHSNLQVEGVKSVFSLSDLGRCVASADFTVNLLPLTTKTEKIFSEAIFGQMKSSGFFINIGRGETVDEAALVSALRTKLIAGAGLDVFAEEPLPGSSALLDLENVILTPHVAGLSSGYWPRQEDLFSFNLAQYVKGELNEMRNIEDMRMSI